MHCWNRACLRSLSSPLTNAVLIYIERATAVSHPVMSREGACVKLAGKRLLLYKKSQARGQILEAVEKIHRCPDKGVPCGQEQKGTASLVKQD